MRVQNAATSPSSTASLSGIGAMLRASILHGDPWQTIRSISLTTTLALGVAGCSTSNAIPPMAQSDPLYGDRAAPVLQDRPARDSQAGINPRDGNRPGQPATTSTAGTPVSRPTGRTFWPFASRTDAQGPGAPGAPLDWQRGGTPPLPNNLSASSNVELTRNLQFPNVQPLQIPERTPNDWGAPNQGSPSQSGWTLGAPTSGTGAWPTNSSPPSATSDWRLPGQAPTQPASRSSGQPQVLPIPRESSSAQPGGQGRWTSFGSPAKGDSGSSGPSSWDISTPRNNPPPNTAPSWNDPPTTLPNPADLVAPRPANTSSTSFSPTPGAGPNLSVDTLKSVLDSRGVESQFTPVAEGVRLTVLAPDVNQPGSRRMLEVTAADYASAVQAMLPRIDALRGR